MIKAIAVDMDGTFLNSNNDYDRKAFLELFKKIKSERSEICGSKWKSVRSNKFFFFQKFGKK